VVGLSTEPVVLGGEAHLVDGGLLVEGVKVLTVVDIPEHLGTVLTTGTAEGTIGGDGDGVENTGVALEVGFQLTVVKVPDLDELVPTAGDDQGVLSGGGEPDAGDPVGVVVLGDGVLALLQGVPKFDLLIPGTGDDLPVVSGELDGVDVFVVTLEEPDGGTGVKVPQPHGLIHGTGELELTVGGDDGIADLLVVAGELPPLVTGLLTVVVTFLGNLVIVELPANLGLVPGTGNNQVGLFVGGLDTGDPVLVPLELTPVMDLSGHLLLFF